jgi:hypothetical protein
MTHDQILTELRRYRDGIDRAIRALEGPPTEKPADVPAAAPEAAPAPIEALPPRAYPEGQYKTAKGRSYNGQHWTQTPEGKRRMRRIQRAVQRRKRAGAQ